MNYVYVGHEGNVPGVIGKVWVGRIFADASPDIETPGLQAAWIEQGILKPQAVKTAAKSRTEE